MFFAREMLRDAMILLAEIRCVKNKCTHKAVAIAAVPNGMNCICERQEMLLTYDK